MNEKKKIINLMPQSNEDFEAISILFMFILSMSSIAVNDVNRANQSHWKHGQRKGERRNMERERQCGEREREGKRERERERQKGRKEE